MIRVAIIDDHVVVRAGLRYILEADPELEYVGEYGGGLGAVDFVMLHNPDVVLLDVRMPDRSGIDALKDILAANPKARVVMLTTSDAEEDVFRAIEEGALGYVMKESELDVISAAIRSAMAGEVYMTDEVRKIYETRKGSKGLSAREAQALKFAATGANNREIAKEMGLSENSVKMFLKRAFFKLGASNRAEAVQLAVKRGLIEAGFTLVELMVVTVVLAVLMTMVFKLAGIGDESAARTQTVDRMHRLENALSGYYATFGTYPPVKEHYSPNPFIQTNDYGDQDPNGGEISEIWGWIDSTGTSVKNGRAEENAWNQVKSACKSQPVACQFPFPPNSPTYELILEISDVMRFNAQSMPDSPMKRVYEHGFDDGTTVKMNRFQPYIRETNWNNLQLFQFGLLSYLLPRYLVMMGGEEKKDMKEFFSRFSQWTGHNVLPRDPLTGDEMPSWDYMQEQFLSDSNNKSAMAHVVNIPSQAACARWIASLDRTVSCNHSCVLFGVEINRDDGNYCLIQDLSEKEDPEVHVPGGFEHGDISSAYMLDKMTILDGWKQDLFYYSPPPYQSYILWSAGPNGRTFPPWIPRETLSEDANLCIGYWVKDDIVNMSH